MDDLFVDDNPFGENVETIIRKLDNRSLILALDHLYRESMKWYEVDTLLGQTKELLERLSIQPGNFPIEGYYTESKELTEYFLNMRTLQRTEETRAFEVEASEAYKNLAAVMSSEIFGSTGIQRFFPHRHDPLYHALKNLSVEDWTVDQITQEAHAISKNSDDISLVGLAAYINDPVVLAGLRESVALYADIMMTGAPMETKIVYKWEVDQELQDRVNRFVHTFNKLTSSGIQPAEPENVEYFYYAFKDNKVLGRCIFIGSDPSEIPGKNYHWGINSRRGELFVDDFWSEEVWTTERYKREKLYF
ncbi:MAG: hypothetical protein AAGD96_06635 [Chloroflexota bacterium]